MIPDLLDLNPEYIAINIRPFDAEFKQASGTSHKWSRDDWKPQRHAPVGEYLDWLFNRAAALRTALGNQKVIFLLGTETLRPNPVVDYLMNRVVAILKVVFPTAEFAQSHWGRDKYIGRDVYSDFSVAHLYYPPGSVKNYNRLDEATSAVDAFNAGQMPGRRKMHVMARFPLGGCYENLSFTLKGEKKRSANPFTPVHRGQTWELGERLKNTVHAVTFWPGIGDDRIPNTWEHFRYFAEGMTGVRHSVEG